MRSSGSIGMILAAASLAGGIVIVRDRRDDRDLGIVDDIMLAGPPNELRLPASKPASRKRTVEHKHSREIARRLRQEARKAAKS